MKKIFLTSILFFFALPCFCWGFYAHRLINQYAVFLLPPQMMPFYKKHIDYLSEHAVDPDKRRYAVAEEGPRHYIDIDRYGAFPFIDLPRRWEDAVLKYSEDSLQRHGILPWWLQIMQHRLTTAFRNKEAAGIIKLSAEIGHYLADAHVPLHASSNHNGQLTNQQGIHAFWESRVPELLAEKEWDFLIGKAEYISRPAEFVWSRILESAAAADTVLAVEKKLSEQFPPDKKFSFEERSGRVVRQYSTGFALAYNRQLNGMIERRMRQSVLAVASFWYSAWVDAGQPDLASLANHVPSIAEREELEALNQAWLKNGIIGREHE